MGLWADRSEIKALWKCDNTYQPAMSTERRDHCAAYEDAALQGVLHLPVQADGDGG